MADIITPKITLKQWFHTGAKPTEDQFANWMDSYWHKTEAIDITSISNLSGKLSSFASEADLDLLSNKVTTLTSSNAGKLDCSPNDNIEYVLYNGSIIPLSYYIESSYTSLQTMKSNGSLTPGMWYMFSFKSIYVQPGTNIVMGLQGQTNELGADVSSLQYTMMIQAIDTNKFSKDVKITYVYDDANNVTHDYSKYCHLWTVEYMFDNDTTRCAWIDADQSMGAITRLIDHNGNESYYDHLNIRFRLYPIDTTKIKTYVSTNTYTAYSDLVWTDSNKNTIAYFTDKKKMMPIAYINTGDTTGKYQSFSYSGMSRFNIEIPVVKTDYIDRVTFDTNCKSNYLSKTDFTDLHPNIFNNAMNVKLPGYSETNVFVNCSHIQFTLPDNYNNILYNTYQCTFDYNSDTNTILSCWNISAQQGFYSNNISSSYRINYYHECNNSQLYSCSDIDLKDQANDIFAYSSHDITFEGASNNIILPLNTYNLTIKQSVSNLDLYLSTQLNSSKSKEIIIDESGLCRLLYYGSNGVAQLTSPTA